mmetsp:Transcript_1880/g.4783  ORF Transcript_1880/g.4783 Transcript_1880/m.4783 type:complete len:239 (+) Transcript_1880:386-1102(+)
MAHSGHLRQTLAQSWRWRQVDPTGCGNARTRRATRTAAFCSPRGHRSVTCSIVRPGAATHSCLVSHVRWHPGVSKIYVATQAMSQRILAPPLARIARLLRCVQTVSYQTGWKRAAASEPSSPTRLRTGLSWMSVLLAFALEMGPAALWLSMVLDGAAARAWTKKGLLTLTASAPWSATPQHVMLLWVAALFNRPPPIGKRLRWQLCCSIVALCPAKPSVCYVRRSRCLALQWHSCSDC